MNTLITPTWVVKSIAANYNNEIRLIGQFDKTYSDNWKNKPEGVQIGDTIQARIQQRFTVYDGQALQTQAIQNQTVPISIGHQLQVAWSFSSVQMALDVEEITDRYMKPGGEALANAADVIAGKEMYKTVYFNIGTFGGGPIASNKTYTDGRALLANAAVPKPYAAVIDPLSTSAILAANVALFGPRYQEYFKSGQFAEEALGIEMWMEDPNIPTHTSGTFTAATPIVSGASQTGSTLALSGLGTYAFKAGDTFTLAGVNLVNPVSYADMATLQQFVVTADISGTTTGTLSISPSIITSGPYQTVTASPANGAAVTFSNATGTVSATMVATVSRQSLIFNKGAFAVVTADLPEDLAGARAKRIASKKAGMAIRWVEQFNIQTNQQPSRLDSMIGFGAVLPYFAARAFS